ncbi:DUF6233 domain-containing protein [Streptomyces sp. NPDC087568]|uniref:DUF6233 domain-containing protein n=1 Tax=unclassified Streptomyces TaxID=2593676 RepID=UPI0037F794EB
MACAARRSARCGGPRSPWAGSGPEWVLQALPQDAPDRRTLVLHRADCWAAKGRLTPASGSEALIFVQQGWAAACDVCEPVPGDDRGHPAT